MKKSKLKKAHKSIGTAQLKFNCKFNNSERVFDEVTIRVKYRPQAEKSLLKGRWTKMLKPSFLFKQITEIIKTMF